MENKQKSEILYLLGIEEREWDERGLEKELEQVIKEYQYLDNKHSQEMCEVICLKDDYKTYFNGKIIDSTKHLYAIKLI